MPTVDLYRGVYSDEQVYEDAGGVHKMGHIRAGDNVHLIEEYGGWYRIDPSESEAPDLYPAHDVGWSPGEPVPLDPQDADYKQWWVKDREEPQLFGPWHEDEEEPPTEPEEPAGFIAWLVSLLRAIADFLEGKML